MQNDPAVIIFAGKYGEHKQETYFPGGAARRSPGFVAHKKECWIEKRTIHSVSRKRRNLMPDFGNAFSGLAHDRKLTHSELVRAIRFMVAAEYEAIQLYTQLAESTDNELAKAVLQDIAEEEIVHAGEFLRLLKELEPDEEGYYKKGFDEVEEMIEKVKK
jgi:hypothetical protein